jgi:hypothetical protein
MGFVERGMLSGRSVLAALEPIREGSRRIGFVGAAIPTSELAAMMDRGRAASGADRGARAAIVDARGQVIAQSMSPASAPALPVASDIANQLGAEPVFLEVQGGDAVIVPLYAPDLYAVMSWAPQQPPRQRAGGVVFSIAAPLLIWMLAIGRGFARGEDIADPPALLSAPVEIRSLRRTLAAMAKTLRGRELRLVEALSEERALLRELHHRVKNNLQMVASLLNIQARSAPDESEAWGLARARRPGCAVGFRTARVAADAGARRGR